MRSTAEPRRSGFATLRTTFKEILLQQCFRKVKFWRAFETYRTGRKMRDARWQRRAQRLKTWLAMQIFASR